MCNLEERKYPKTNFRVLGGNIALCEEAYEDGLPFKYHCLVKLVS